MPTTGRMQTAGLVGYWKFNNDSGVGENYTTSENYTVYDYSGLGNNGIVKNSGTGIMFNASGGKFGGGMQFDGLDDYVDCGSDV